MPHQSVLFSSSSYMTSTSDAGDVLRPLRAATGELHQYLDSRLPIARSDATLLDYADHLRTLRPWLLAQQRVLARPAVPALEAASRRIAQKLIALDADLHDAGVPLPPLAGLAKHLAGAPAEIEAFAWGAAYVVEGSQLGGVVMRKRLSERLAPHPLRYFAAAGSGAPGAHWQAFVGQLGAALGTPAAIEAAQRGAIASFEDLIARFRTSGLLTAVAA